LTPDGETVTMRTFSYLFDEFGRLVCWGDSGSGQCTVSSDLQVMMPETGLATLLVPAGIQPQQTDEVELLRNQLVAASAERDQFKRQLESIDESNVEVRCGVETLGVCVCAFICLWDCMIRMTPLYLLREEQLCRHWIP
jgi:hypothetical protein